MLEKVLRHIRNYFAIDIVRGKFTITDGEIKLPFIIHEGQYFRISESVFNDGVYMYPCCSLHDETFAGCVSMLAIPDAVLDLSERIEDWEKQYADVVNSPFQSESFGGYSYSKKTSGGNGQNGSVSWQSQFADELNQWRKI